MQIASLFEHLREVRDACGPRRDDRGQPLFPQLEAMAFLVLVGVLVINTMQAWLGVRNDEFTNKILRRQRRQMSAHRPPKVMNYPTGDTAELVYTCLRLAEAIDRLLASGGGEQIAPTAPP